MNGRQQPTAGRLINEFISARKDRSLVVLEGLHAVKHALRFGADIKQLVARDKPALEKLARRLAPDVTDSMLDLVREVPDELYDRLAPRPPKTGVIGLARRPEEDALPRSGTDDAGAGVALIAAHRSAPLILLERPSHLGNIGAVIRVAAGAGAAGVIATGIHDPWSPDAVRGGAGLQFALPVARIPDPLPTVRRRNGPLLVLDPEGDPLTASSIPSDAIVAFGSERSGLSEELIDEADRRIAIPMKPGVSSLNLATSVAVVLYTWRLHHG